MYNTAYNILHIIQWDITLLLPIENKQALILLLKTKHVLLDVCVREFCVWYEYLQLFLFSVQFRDNGFYQAPGNVCECVTLKSDQREMWFQSLLV